jgi:hypothetical protein
MPPRKRIDLNPPPAVPEPTVEPAPKAESAPKKWTVRFSEEVYVAIGKRAVTVDNLEISDGLVKLSIDGREYLVSLAGVLFIRRE